MPDEPDADVLASRFHTFLSEPELAIEKMRSACRRKNARPENFFQLNQLLQADALGGGSDEVQSLLKSARELSPNNMVLGVAYMDSLAKAKNKELLSELEAAEELLRSVIARTESRIPKLLEQAMLGVEKEDWRTTQTQVAFLRNVLLAEIGYQNDLHALEPHDLEYLQLEFSDSILAEKPIAVSNRDSKRSFSTEKGTVFLQDVTAVVIEDFNLDSVFDVIVAKDRQIEVWDLLEGKLANKQTSVTLESTIKGLVAADLDHDYQFRKDALPGLALPTTAPPDAPVNTNAKLVDTDVDLIAYGADGVRLLKNDLDASSGIRSLIEMPQSEAFQAQRQITALSVIDFDHDSDLDLAIASNLGLKLWSNRGDWTFADFTQYSQLPSPEVKITSILALDLDRNVLNDFLLGVDLKKPVLLSNSLHGRYRLSDLAWGNAIDGGANCLRCDRCERRCLLGSCDLRTEGYQAHHDEIGWTKGLEAGSCSRAFQDADERPLGSGL